MNIQILAPEITSMQMFSGMGSAPLLSAAAGWNDLAGELGSAASSPPSWWPEPGRVRPLRR